MNKYRHEHKFLADERELVMIQNSLNRLLRLDRNVSENGSYRIRSAYFDDYRDTCLRQNEAGTDPRAKFRIRIYDASDQRIMLEKKSKKKEMTLKESAPLTRAQCERLLSGRPLPADARSMADYPELVRRFNTLVMMRLMRPKVIVEYVRVPFVCPEGNVRITFDKNISASGQTERFFEKDILKCPVMAPGQHILEVKYDEFLPSYISRRLELGTLRQTSFSKYYLCRLYGKGIG